MQEYGISLMWQRLDQPGHEVLKCAQVSDGTRIEGYAAYREDGRFIGLHYSVAINSDWTTRDARIDGNVDGTSFSHRIERANGRWLLDGVEQAGLADIPHLDFGFTPATNMAQVRHANLQVGETAHFDVAWFDVGPPSLERLPQSYHRIGELEYAYDSPQGGYSALLRFAPDGFSTDYPGLWKRVGA